MNDTSVEIDARYRSMIMAIKPQERLKMVGGMWDSGKRLVMSSIRNEFPEISDQELRRKFFSRIYRNDFSSDEMDKILSQFR